MVRRVSVQYFRQMTHTALVHQDVGAGQNRLGIRCGTRAVYLDPGFTKSRQQPGPSGAVMIGGFAPGIFIARIGSLIGSVGIHQPLAVVVDMT